MDVERIKSTLGQAAGRRYDLYERRPGAYQLILPILHEDGDMLEIYLQESSNSSEEVRICDFGHALMRLSYNFELSTEVRRRILDSILINNGVRNDQGNLYLDTPVERLYESVLQFAGCIQKVCNMRYWGRETVRSSFFEDLKEYVTTGLTQFAPVANPTPLPDYSILSVDWALTHNFRNLYLFGVGGNNKAKNVAISLLEFKKAHLLFISFVVHDDMEELGRSEKTYGISEQVADALGRAEVPPSWPPPPMGEEARTLRQAQGERIGTRSCSEVPYLTRNADKQYPDLDAFKGDGVPDIRRLAGVAS